MGYARATTESQANRILATKLKERLTKCKPRLSESAHIHETGMSQQGY